MDRSERRWRTAHKKAQRVRYYCDYLGASHWYYTHTGTLWWTREIEKPWRIDGVLFMHEAPGWWVNTFMTRPGAVSRSCYCGR